MADISFEILYGEDKNAAFKLFTVWVNDFFTGIGSDPVPYDSEKAFRFVSNLQKSDFPAKGNNYDGASPFKKAGYIYTWLQDLDPFMKNPLPSSVVGEHLSGFKNTSTCLIGFSLVRECLKGATLTKITESGEEESVVIVNPINVSRHLFQDLVEASRGITVVDHYKMICLFFESLTYEANEGLCYGKMFK